MNQLLTTFTAAPHPYLAEKHAFSSKERDTETGLSYFGARYYSSDLSIWLSVDPLSDKYPHQSNYVYCSNNPLQVIDPNGEDEWDLARDGTLNFKKSNPDKDIVYATNSKGDPVYLELPVGSVNKGTGSYEYYDKSQNKTTQYMTFNKQEGYDFFEFAAENTDVEWAISSSDCESRVGTAKSNNVSMPSVKNEKEFYHSHDENHTGYTYVGKDDYDAAEVSFKRGTTRVGIYMAGERCYYMFEERTFPNGTFYFIEGKTNERKSK